MTQSSLLSRASHASTTVMRHLLTSLALVALTTTLSALPAPSLVHAQAASARPTGTVRGLDLQLEGSLTGVRGRDLRWLVTAYEVLGMSTLRLAPDAEIQLTTSLDPTAEPRVSRTDAHGRTLIALPLPADAPESFTVVLRASRGSVQRRFELTVHTTSARELAVRPLRTQVAPEGELPIAVIARDVASEAAVPELPLRLEILDAAGRQLLPRVELRTDAWGLAHHVIRLPREATGTVMLHAVSGERAQRLEDSVSVQITAPARSGQLLVAISPAQWVAEPRSTMQVEVVVRNEEGRPIEGAILDVEDTRSYEERRRAPLHTDARGHARYTYRVPEIGGPYQDVPISVTASHELEGRGYASTTIRAARVERVATFAVEGGGLVPGLGGRIYVRAVDVNGTPSPAGVEVELRGPRIGSRRGTTDASGVAVLDVPTLATLAPGAQDRCGGDAATAIDVLVRGAEGLESCLALDPDGGARVRLGSPVVRPGQPIHVEVARAATAAHLPVSVRVLERDSMRAIAAAVIGGNDASADLTIPEGVRGRLLVLARPLFGSEEREVRGGAVQGLVLAGDPFAISARVEARAGGATLHVGAVPNARAFIVAAPLEELERHAELDLGGLGVSTRTDLATASPALIAAALAVTTERDAAAPFALRENGARVEAIAVPAPTDPTALALLRDPWRSQARFLTGRLALLFRAVEQRVAGAVPEHLDDVAIETNGRWDFNAQIVASVADGGDLGGEGATGLGGEPITVEALRAFDPAFTYDNVARRITRERLFRLLVALRRFVLQNGYDIPWARLGDPSTWLAHTTELYDQSIGQLGTRELVDGWGRPFALAPVSGAPRYGAWQPLPGWEVYSLGPDGRARTGDDVVDPTARVLPSGSAYAQSVGEDGLVARLTGVELGRATVLDLGQASGEGWVGIPSSPEGASAGVAASLWEAVPARLRVPVSPLSLRRPSRTTDGDSALVDLDGHDVALTLDEEPREWGVVVVAVTPTGMASLGLAHALLGSPLIVEGELPGRVRVGEPIEVELRVTSTASRDLSLALDAQAEGPLTFSGPSTLSIPAETSTPLRVRLDGTGPGHAHAILRFLDGAQAVRTARSEHAVDRGLHPVRTRAALASASGTHFDLDLEGPSDGRDAVGRVVVMRPTALGLDPDLDDARDADPGLVAWSLRMAGRPLDEPLRARLSQDRLGAMPRLSLACALVAWSSADAEDEAAQAAAARVRSALGSYGAGDPVDSAAVLAALSPGGVFELADTYERDLDSVAQLVARERSQLRRGLRRYPEEPSLLARAAAALLLADPRDAYGRAMLDRLRSHLEVVERGGARGRVVVPSSMRDQPIERLVATLALSVAARQLGETALAEELLRGAAFDDHVVIRAGGEALFWWLAAGAYGVLLPAADGPAPSDSITVVVDGRTLTATLENGFATIPLTGSGARPSVSVRTDGPVVVRGESLSFGSFEERHDAPLTLSIVGEPGDARHVASLELTVHADREVREPVLHVQLPAGARADDALLGAIRSAPGVTSAELRTPGLVRIRLVSLASGTDTRITLPLSWMVRGTVHGLAVVAFEANVPGRMTILPQRAFTIP
ncbi:MAG: hypothetical protein K1X94_19490 [Sandaracinaceae bacterium]|nr:hypothetical protein [Sandaracinaceae bacterium]